MTIRIEPLAEFEKWALELTTTEFAAVDRYIGLLRARGVTLPFPYSSEVKGSRYALRELRVSAGRSEIRVFYLFDTERAAILLLGGNKTGARGKRFYAEHRKKLGKDIKPQQKRRSKNMATKADRWEQLRRKKLSAAQLAENDRWVRQELVEMDLRSMREMLGKTQTEAAEAAKITQAELSRAERRGDHLVSTLRRYVEGLGGELEVVAHFGDKSVRLRGV